MAEACSAEEGRMTEAHWRESGSTYNRLLRVNDAGAGELWALGPMVTDNGHLVAVVDGPQWQASWRASQLMPCAAHGEEEWQVTKVTVDLHKFIMEPAPVRLIDHVCQRIKRGDHLRLEQSSYPEVTLKDTEYYDSFEDARAAAYRWVQQQVPEHERHHSTYRGLYDPP